MLGRAGWAPSDNRYSFQIGQIAYIRNIDTADQLQFQAPEGAYVQYWLAGGSELLLVKDGGSPSLPKRNLYIMEATTGATSEVVLPAEASVDPHGEFVSFSPDGSYISYSVGNFQSGWDLWIMERATGRTCLLVRIAPGHQHPRGAGWSQDGRSATYYTKFSEQHAVDVENCADTAIAATPPLSTPTKTKVPIPGLVIGTNASSLRSPSGRYLLVSVSPPSDGRMYIVDEQTGSVTTLVDEQREFSPSAWLP